MTKWKGFLAAPKFEEPNFRACTPAQTVREGGGEDRGGTDIYCNPPSMQTCKISWAGMPTPRQPDDLCMQIHRFRRRRRAV